MTAPEHPHSEDLMSGAKYRGEAHSVAQLLETNTAEAGKRLSLDSSLSPKESDAFLQQVKLEYDADRVHNDKLPVLDITHDKDGYHVGLKTDTKTESVFDKKYTEAEKAADKPIPKTGELLGLTKEETQRILDAQKAEKESGKPAHKFGELAVSMGLRKPEEVNAALEKQDHLVAQRMVAELQHSMPVGNGEGYYQLLKRTHPELSNHDAVRVAHEMRLLNGGKTVLHKGDVLKTFNDDAAKKIEQRMFEYTSQKVGGV